MNENLFSADRPPLKDWELDESKLTAQDKQVLNSVYFPRVVKKNEMLQRVVSKFGRRGDFVFNPNVEAKDIAYKKVSRKIGLDQIRKHGRHQAVAIAMASGNTSQAERIVVEYFKANNLEVTPANIKAEIEHCSDVTKPKAKIMFYVDAGFIQNELDDLLARFSDPKPTPSMKKVVEEVATIEVETPKKTALSNTAKGKAKKMYKDEGKDAKEIAEALGTDVQKVIDYLQKLD